MLSKRAYLSTFLMMSLVAISSWFSIRDQKERSTEAEKVFTRSKATQVQLSQMNIQGQLKYKVRANFAEQYSNEQTVLHHPVIELYHQNSPDPWMLRAQQALVIDPHQKITLEGDIVISRAAVAPAPAVELYTEHLTLYPDQNYAETDDPVNIKIPETGTNMLSTGMKAYLYPEKLELLSHIRSTYDRLPTPVLSPTFVDAPR